MRSERHSIPERVLAVLAGVLVVKVTASVVSNYHDYIPPNFASDLLRGREGYFFGWYRWAFYCHILSGPVTLILGLVLVGERHRRRLPRWHRWLGWLQVACVVLLVTPSGLAMAWYTQAGPIAGAGLSTLALATAVCVYVGARSAMKRRFADHRRWMWRCYLLLCSAVVLRLIGGLATVTAMTAWWVDPLANWLSWLAPLGAFEVRERMLRRSRATVRGRLLAQATQEHGALFPP
ncbi:MAG: DUF2306 domain-containing protein [Isosphaeraceae bacterium]